MSRASPDYEKAHTRLDKAEQNAMKEAKDEHINRTWQEALADILATIVVTKLEDYVEEHTYNPGPFIRTNPFMEDMIMEPRMASKRR